MLAEPINPCNLEVDPRSTTKRVLRDKTAAQPPSRLDVDVADQLIMELPSDKRIALARTKDQPGVDGCLLNDDRPIQVIRITSSSVTRLIDKYNHTLQVAPRGKWTNILLFVDLPTIKERDLRQRWSATGPGVVPTPQPGGGVVTRVLVIAEDAIVNLPIPT